MSISEKELGWRVASVKFVNANVVGVLTCEILTAMGKRNFSAVLYWNRFVGHQGLVQDVHHFDFFTETNYDLETTRMQRQ